MSQPTYVTAAGLQKIKDELKERIDVRRVDIADRLDKAIQMGDLKENADYHAAKEDQAFNEGRIQQLNDSVLNAVVIEKRAGGRISMGSTVVIAEEGFEDEEEEYEIVGASEADPAAGRISNESPIGRAIIGANVGDVVSANTPGGIMRFKILRAD